MLPTVFPENPKNPEILKISKNPKIPKIAGLTLSGPDVPKDEVKRLEGPPTLDF